MIRSINTNSRFIQIAGGDSPVPYISTYNVPSATQPFVGSIRRSATHNTIEIFDGNHWATMHSHPTTVSLSGMAESALGWAERKMLEEKQLKDRMEKHPGLKDAYERFKIMDILCSEDEKNAESI